MQSSSNEWISFDLKKPNKFPCMGRNYDLKVEDIIIGIDENNHAFKNTCFCKSLPKTMSMPFTHWKSISNENK